MSSSTQLYGYVKDGLTILVLPALLWLVKLEVSNAERDFQLQQTKIDIERLEARINEMSLRTLITEYNKTLYSWLDWKVRLTLLTIDWTRFAVC